MAATGDQDVDRAALVQDAGVGKALLRGLGLGAKQAADLVVVGLDEEGLGGKRAKQQGAGGIDDEADATARQAMHDHVVGGVGQAGGNGAGEHDRVTLARDLQAVEKLLELALGNLGAHAVDDGHDDAVELDVDARVALVQAHEVRGDALVLQGVDEVVAGEATADAHGGVGNAQLVEDSGDVDAVAAAVHFLARGAVGESHVERQRVHDVVDGGVQRYGVNQQWLLPTRERARTITLVLVCRNIEQKRGKIAPDWHDFAPP